MRKNKAVKRTSNCTANKFPAILVYMKIYVLVKPNAIANGIERTGEDKFTVRVKAKPEKGRANQAVIEVLAEYFGIAKTCVELLKGRSSRQKTFEIRGH